MGVIRSACDEWTETYFRALPYRDERRRNQQVTVAGMPLALPERLQLHSLQHSSRRGPSKRFLNTLERDWLAAVVSKPETTCRDVRIAGFALDALMMECQQNGTYCQPTDYDHERSEYFLKRYLEWSESYGHHLDYAESRFTKSDRPIGIRVLRHRKRAAEDCWLLLIAPLISEYRWTASDIVAALRCRFTPLAVCDVSKVCGGFTHSGVVTSGVQADWPEELLRQPRRAERDAIRKRCERLVIKLDGRPHRPSGERDLPEMFRLALKIEP